MELGTDRSTPTSARIDPRTAVGAVSLRVSDVARSQAFYSQVLGLTAIEELDGGIGFGAAGGEAPLVVIHGDGSAPALDRHATGLFHLAILLPSRSDLALALARVVEARWPLDGASDHLVSEALYLSDPDGNGIELYRDRPRDEWRRNGDELAMATLPLDLDDVMSAAGGLASSEPSREVPAGTTIGHVHLQVADLGVSESFYRGVLGFDVTVRSYPGALFLSAGGYHHHIGLNTWRSAGGRRPVEGAVGLRHFEIVVSDQAELERVLARVRDAGVNASACDGGSLVQDPSGIGVLLRAA